MFLCIITKMYSRILSEPPKKLIKNGKPIFGTFINAPDKLDIRGVLRPFGVIPLPTFITDLRIRSNLSFTFDTDEYIGTIDFLDIRIFGHVEVVFFEKKSGRKLSYRSIIGPRRRLIPKKTDNGVCISFNKNRYIKISWDKKRGTINAVLNLKGDSVRPSVTAALCGNLNAEDAGVVASVLPAPIMRRCRATWLLSAPLEGNISLHEKTDLTMPVKNDISGKVLFETVRAYYKLRSKRISSMATGFVKNHSISFAITSSNLEAVDQDAYNENVLFCDGVLTPLPPVKITYPFGIRGKWIIQDTENMVDLTFTPISDHLRILSVFVLRTQSHTIYGKFEGVIRTKDGEDIVLKDFSGIVKKQLMRL